MRFTIMGDFFYRTDHELLRGLDSKETYFSLLDFMWRNLYVNQGVVLRRLRVETNVAFINGVDKVI